MILLIIGGISLISLCASVTRESGRRPRSFRSEILDLSFGWSGRSLAGDGVVALLTCLPAAFGKRSQPNLQDDTATSDDGSLIS